MPEIKRRIVELVVDENVAVLNLRIGSIEEDHDAEVQLEEENNDDSSIE